MGKISACEVVGTLSSFTPRAGVAKEDALQLSWFHVFCIVIEPNRRVHLCSAGDDASVGIERRHDSPSRLLAITPKRKPLFH